MPNTSLPTVQVGTTGRIAQTNIVHEEINRLSRDTGWRDVSGLIRSSWTVAAARIRRVDYQVVLEVTGLDSSTSTGALLLSFGANSASDLSSNFAPEGGAFRLPTFESASGRVQFYGNESSGLNVAFLDGTSLGTAFKLQVAWATFKGWPNFLPPTV